MTNITPGDIVFVGPAGPLDRKRTWLVVNIHNGLATLRSGMTERTTVAPLERLTPFRPRLAEPAAP